MAASAASESHTVLHPHHANADAPPSDDYGLSTRSSSYSGLREPSGSQDITIVGRTGPERGDKEGRVIANGGIPRSPGQQDPSYVSVTGSDLFRLPREVRDKIYRMCLTAHGGNVVEWLSAHQPWAMSPKLLGTCKAVYHEAGPLLYAMNTLGFHHPSDANMLVRAISCPTLAQKISSVSLVVRAQDTRLWVPYLDSSQKRRSLKSDFPNLRQLDIRFKSNKWQHTQNPWNNLRSWHEDSRLDEIVDCVRTVFLTRGCVRHPHPDSGVAAMPDAPEPSPLDLHSTQTPRPDRAHGGQWEIAPTIKVVCACRVHPTHFHTLTRDDRPTATPPFEGGQIPLELLEYSPAPQPVVEGDVFTVFSAADLKGKARESFDPDLGATSSARTAFACKMGILLALEIYSTDGRREAEGG